MQIKPFQIASILLLMNVGTSPQVIRWTATLPVKTSYSAMQVKVIRP
jgi:hypothetical protein